MKTHLMTILAIQLFFSFFTPSVQAEEKQEIKILFLGDSLTEGYGINKDESYPMIFKQLVKERLSKDIEVLNGSVSGSTTSSALSRLRWFVRQKPQIVLLALGANDGLRGISIDVSQKNLEQTIELALENQIQVVLAGMLLPTNYGEEYRQNFEKMFAELAKKYQLRSIAFLLEGVAAQKELNQADGIHPNEQGHRVMAETVFNGLKELL